MVRFPAFVAALCLCACNPLGETGEPKGPDGSSANLSREHRDTAAPVRVQGDSGAPPVKSPRLADTASEGETELRRLAEAGQSILVPGGSGVEVAPGEFVADLADNPSEYAGRYHFGDSEGESTLTLEVQGSAVSGALGYADWENETWVGKELRLDGGRISGARLTAPEWSGVFVRYQGKPGLVILRAPEVISGVEYGRKLDAARE
jgi:hypothetical protein